MPSSMAPGSAWTVVDRAYMHDSSRGRRPRSDTVLARRAEGHRAGEPSAVDRCRPDGDGPREVLTTPPLAVGQQVARAERAGRGQDGDLRDSGQGRAGSHAVLSGARATLTTRLALHRQAPPAP